MNGDDRNICAFAVDAGTERVLKEALDGYQNGKVHRGGMAAAVKHLTGASSPQVVVVDLDGSKFPAGSIHELAGVCEVGTSVIAVGSNDTARLARELLATGVDDYFPKPLSAGEIREALRAALGGDHAPARLHAGRVIAFAGCGGGCGATTLAAVTVQASAARGSYVAAVDLARTFSALPWMLDVEPPAGLDEMLGMAASGRASGADMLDAVCAAAGPRISLYGYRQGDGLPPAPSPAAVHWLTEQLANRSHLVVVDGMSDADTLFPVLENADERVLVYEPTLASLNHATQVLALLGEGREAVLVENHTRARKSALSPQQVRQALAGREPGFTIPFEPKLPAATNRGRPDESLGKKYRQALDRLVESLARPAVSLAAAAADS
ncbi:MAG: hypothetical protein OXE53_08335 [Deltaproteobacteria bacterium]|nr:hypothetical protein [Deltaproteobacteria bacterium]